MTSPPTVCYYVSGHGLGHAARAAQVIAQLAPGIHVIVKSFAAQVFFQRESGRRIEYFRESFDVGVHQHNNRELDWDKTFREAAALQRNAAEIVAHEVQFLRSRGVRCVVSDVAALPLCAARDAGIPCLLIANFTWADIYRTHARRSTIAANLVKGFEESYECADLALTTSLSFPMRYLPRQEDVGLVARRGSNIRNQLARHIGASKADRLVLLYFGNWGNADINFSRALHQPGTGFVSFTPVPAPAHQLDPGEWHFPDVLASVDAVLAKPGYGTVGECMANGTPLVYYPRADFAEYPVIRRAMQQWGGAVQISSRDFLQGRWAPALSHAMKLSPKKVPAPGAKRIAREIEKRLARS
jgi:hypothetical protein